ncbi:MAG TPA: hypothetical protein VI895_13835 [Bdellovibrionota bacterium]|nr:hypothetical protein [Bdellovibrionota bacterium]
MNRFPARAISLGVAVVWLTCLGHAQEERVSAAASQPSADQPYPRVSCGEWPKDRGKEGRCDIETENTTWELGYFREGKEKRSLKNVVKNLIVVFHPDGYSHRIHEWWDSMVGPGKALDTDRWVILSLATLGDGKPQKGAPLLLTADEMLSCQTGVVDFLYPKSKAIVGGPSRGGQIAIHWALRNPERIEGLFLVNVHGYSQIEEKPILSYLESIEVAERSQGPYVNWSTERKGDWWKPASRLYVGISYTDEYFKQPRFMVEVGKKPEEYRDAKTSFDLTVTSWNDFFRDFVDPHWFLAQVSTLDRATDALGDDDFSKLPKKILLAWNPDDKTVLQKDVARFSNLLKKQGKRVIERGIADPRGHMACCSVEMPQDTQSAIRAFLKD